MPNILYFLYLTPPNFFISLRTLVLRSTLIKEFRCTKKLFFYLFLFKKQYEYTFITRLQYFECHNSIDNDIYSKCQLLVICLVICLVIWIIGSQISQVQNTHHHRRQRIQSFPFNLLTTSTCNEWIHLYTFAEPKFQFNLLLKLLGHLGRTTSSFHLPCLSHSQLLSTLSIRNYVIVFYSSFGT